MAPSALKPAWGRALIAPLRRAWGRGVEAGARAQLVAPRNSGGLARRGHGGLARRGADERAAATARRVGT